eukprot:TRINITY_DN2749_c0_g1_i1.p1 TRINITY_DN2749_c0_g1~~TRINITY_DN2749_c0_g1_i1.p1  ORF type:complete len:551 (-),score=124.47 TRINITY_DN2749_c0_g1_i1:438-2090(-)
MSTKEAKKDSEKAPVEEEVELSEEDQKIKAELELLVERVGDENEEIVKAAINAMKKEIRTSTSSMTSVPKPLKFLRPHYDTLKATYEKLVSHKDLLADVISWLGMTGGLEEREALKFKLLGSGEDIGIWGHEYVRHLCMEIGDEYQDRIVKDEPVGHLLNLVEEIVPFLLSHNAEPDACDLLLEVEQIERLVEFVSESTYKRICLYLESCTNYLSCPEDNQVQRVVMNIYSQMELIPETLKLALALNDHDIIKALVYKTTDKSMRRQLALMLGQHGYFRLINYDEEGMDEEMEEDDIPLADLMGNLKRSEHFNTVLATDMEISDPKLPEDIYKSHLDSKQASVKLDSARQNLARSFVNGFLNAGFGSDKLLTGTPGADGGWLFKNRDHGRISTLASLGMIHLWDNATGVNELEKYSGLKADAIEAGIMLGIGIANANIRDSFNVALSYAENNIISPSSLVKQCTALALGFAYAGTSHCSSVRALLERSYEEGTPGIELQAHIALALGTTFTLEFSAPLIFPQPQRGWPTSQDYRICNFGRCHVTMQAIKC